MLAAYSLGMAAGGMVGAAAATYRWIQKEGTSSEVASIASTIPGFFNSIVLVLVSSAGMIHLLAAHELSDIQVIRIRTDLTFFDYCDFHPGVGLPASIGCFADCRTAWEPAGQECGIGLTIPLKQTSGLQDCSTPGN